MPVTSITYQPATGQLIAAYRPIVFKVQATATGGGITPPFVICDIYLGNVYYKSIIRTAPESIASTYSVYQFDIADALQESLQADLATINNNNLLQASHSSAKVFCRFRSSDKDADGFTVEEPTVPVQGTKNTVPVAGTGTQSNSFFVINSALQHEDNQNLALHLNAYKQGIWASNAFPLTHRNRYYFCDNDSDHFPLIFTGDCASTKIILHYRLKGQVGFLNDEAQDINFCPSIGFTPSVTGNRVDVHLDSPVTMGTVLVQYKKQADAFWIDVNLFTTQDFFFYVNGDDIAGDYDLRVIHFCTNCLSSDPEIEQFTLTGTITSLGWRGINPYCVASQPLDVYVELDLRNQNTTDNYFPDSDDPTDHYREVTYDLYAKFYSDASHLTPFNLVQDGLKVYVKQKQSQADLSGGVTTFRELESIIDFTGDANGTELLLGAITESTLTETFSGGIVAFSSSSTFVFTPYTSDQLWSGNTGDLADTTLQEYNTSTNIPTGTEKPNVDTDPDYIAPSADTNSCPIGPPQTQLNYDFKLEVAKVEFRVGSNPDFYYAPAVANTYNGSYVYVMALPRFTDTMVTIKAKTLDGSNTTGIVKARVTYVDGNGATQIVNFNLTNNIETALPQTFQNITSVYISNY
jgi:hypothetical protein